MRDQDASGAGATDRRLVRPDDKRAVIVGEHRGDLRVIARGTEPLQALDVIVVRDIARVDLAPLIPDDQAVGAVVHADRECRRRHAAGADRDRAAKAAHVMALRADHDLAAGDRRHVDVADETRLGREEGVGAGELAQPGEALRREPIAEHCPAAGSRERHELACGRAGERDERVSGTPCRPPPCRST